jgi:predicted nucleotidyltransferase component of viral defense system
VKEIKNIAASVRDRLKKLSETHKVSFQLISLLYMQERFLYRLSHSRYAPHFLLKGGLLLFGMYPFLGRSTKDMDFSSVRTSNDLDSIRQIVKEIAQIPCNDGVIFLADSIEMEKIKEGTKYEGTKVKLEGHLDTIKNTIQMDFGFGDSVFPAPRSLDYPILLDSEHFQILAYSSETIISEKFEAMISLSEINSRMKDFFDLYFLMKHESFDGHLLQEAIKVTFERRSTLVKPDPNLFQSSFHKDENRIKIWNAFLKRLDYEMFHFKDVMESLSAFLRPVYDSILNNQEFNKTWNLKKQSWL